MTLALVLVAAPAGPALADTWARGLARRADVVLDESLSRGARRHADAIAAADRPPDDVGPALAAEGLADAQVLTFAAIGTKDALAQRADAFAAGPARALEPTHVGVGRARGPGTEVLVVVWSRRLAELPPLPRTLPQRPFRWVSTLLAGARPRLFVTLPTGEVRELEAHTEGRRVWAELPFEDARGAYDVELLVETRRGPELAALWRAAVGIPARGPALIAPLSDARAVASAVDELRRGAGRTPLRADPDLERAARAHAEAVCEVGVAAHVLGGRGPEARALAEGYRGPLAENVALGPSLGAAHAQLLGSPSHRANLLAPHAVTLGVGATSRGPRYCVVQLLGLSGSRPTPSR